MSNDLSADVENPVFFDPFACVREAVKAARNRNQLALRAKLAGDERARRKHQELADWYIARARMWSNEMEGQFDGN